MKFSLPVEQLEKPLFLVANVVNTKHINQHLQYVKVDIHEGIMRLTGSDGEVEIEAIVGEISSSDHDDTLSALISPKQLQDIVRCVAKGAILELEFSNNKLHIMVGKDHYQLSYMPADNFSHMKLFDNVSDDELVSVNIVANRLLHMMQRVVHAVAQQDIRQYLNGVLLECVQTTLRLVATDSHRLAIVSEQMNVQLSDEIKRFILVRRAVLELMRIITAYADEMLELKLSSHTLVATMPGWRLSTKLMNISYPNYEQVVPPISEQHFVCTNSELKQAIRKTAVVGEQNRGLQLQVKEKSLVCESHNLDTGEMAHTVIDAEVNVDDNVALAFNSKYLADVASIIDDNAKIIFYCSTNQPSVLICPQDEATTRYVIMPIKI